MKVEILYDQDNEIEFLVDGIDTGIANAIRRSIISHVKTLAIDDVYIKENSSALWDEFLAHRLGLVPLSCEESVKEVRFYLKVEGPKTVYAKDLIPDGPVKIVYPDIPIVKLDSGQKIDLFAVAVWGEGVDHAKWSPALAIYRRYVEVIGDKKKHKELYNYAKAIYPEGLKEDKKGKFIIRDALKKEGIIEIAERTGAEIKETDKLVFYIESWGQKDKYQVVKEGIETLKGMLEDFKLRLYGILR